MSFGRLSMADFTPMDGNGNSDVSQFSAAPSSSSAVKPRSDESLREQIAGYLDNVQAPMGIVINGAIAVLILISASIFVAETYDIPPAVQTALALLDDAILAVFILEYGLRLWCASRKWSFVFSLYSILDLLAIVPFLFGFIDIRFLRLFRWFRVLRLVRFLNQQTWLGLVRTDDGIVLARIVFTLFSITFIYSGLIYQVEHPINPEQFANFIDAFYFSVVTMTTVGFGDVTPISSAGRGLTVLMILTGVALIPWQLGELIKRVIKTVDQIKLNCLTCGLSLHDHDALFCKRCGTALPRSQASWTSKN